MSDHTVATVQTLFMVCMVLHYADIYQLCSMWHCIDFYQGGAALCSQYRPYEGTILVNENSRKLGVSDSKLERSQALFYDYVDIH